MAQKAFNKIKAGLEEAVAFAEGKAEAKNFRVRIPADLNVRKIRKGLSLSQEEFAIQFGFTINQIRDWEQGRTRPHHAHWAYLLVISREPKAVTRALKAAA